MLNVTGSVDTAHVNLRPSLSLPLSIYGLEKAIRFHLRTLEQLKFVDRLGSFIILESTMPLVSVVPVICVLLSGSRGIESWWRFFRHTQILGL